jgi:hypothetical protein
MSIRTWHPGKLAILWVWGSLATLLLLTDFAKAIVAVNPFLSAVELVLLLAIPAGLSVVTWHWLGGKEGSPGASESQSRGTSTALSAERSGNPPGRPSTDSADDPDSLQGGGSTGGT